MPDTRSMEIEALRAALDEVRSQVQTQSAMQETINELRAQIYSQGRVDIHHIPEAIKNMADFSGQRKELRAFFEEIDDLYEMYKVKNENGEYCLNKLHLRAIKNHIKGDARTLLCVNGNPDNITEIKRILEDAYGDQRDLPTNLGALVNIKKGDKNHYKFLTEVKELNTRLKANIQSRQMTACELIDAITVTCYLDNISEPLASIIRNSHPKDLEEAYQAVIQNQNAETRAKPPSIKYKPYTGHYGSAKIKQTNYTGQARYEPRPGPSGYNYTRNASWQKPRDNAPNNTNKKFHPSPRVELNYNENENENSDNEINFQTVRSRREQT